ncbi:MAG: Ribosome-recycling factor Frr, partial [Parcubacteria group bacterium GW2011_GWA2_36_10]
NINPVVDSEFVRLNFPPLTEESRKNLVKILGKKSEEAKVALRGQREKIKDVILAAERNKEIAEDERFQALKELDDLTKQYGDKIKEIADQKEAEIMKI